MQLLKGQVAVVTGAASGIGWALARRFARSGLKLVLADIEATSLEKARAQLEADGATAMAMTTDVVVPAQVEALADAAFARFGAVHVVCNNAGVAVSGFHVPAWETKLADWQWVMGVNVMGVVHGIRSFVPRMLALGQEGHIVNTSSCAGLLPGSGPYHASKHAVTCLTEGLYKDLHAIGAKVSASVLCPGHIRTAIANAERNRPAEFGSAIPVEQLPESARRGAAALVAALEVGIEPDVVAEDTAAAIEADRFYIIPSQPQQIENIRARMTAILERRNPPLLGAA